jgi:phytoene dehydrogenase-like protein
MAGLSHESYDIAIIGAGLGGLACGTFLAKQCLKVGVFEQHYVPGGYCHSFRRGPYVFDAAIEYIGCCGEGQDVWRLLQQLGAERFVAFDEMDPDGFDQLCFPKHRVAICKGFDAYLGRLGAMFPRERKGLKEYGAVLSGIWQDIHVWGVGLFLWKFKRFPSACRMMQRSAGKTLDDLFSATIRSRALRAILAGQCGNYALPPSKVDVITHAITVMNFDDGAYYARGGAQQFSNALVKAFKSQGGELFLRRGVRRICLSEGRATGLELENENIVSAGAVVSSADPRTTLLELANGDGVLGRTKRRLRDMEFSLGSFQVYLGVKLDLQKMGLRAANYWVSPTYDFDSLYRFLCKGGIPRRPYFMVSAASLKDSSGTLAPPGEHVVKILTPVSWRSFAEWDQTRLGNRGKSYKDLKERFAQTLISEASKLIPGLRKAIKCCVIGSPLTNTAYTRVPEGAMYGVSRTPRQSGPSGFSAQTPIPGLYLTGTNVYYPGVVGALGAGVMSGAVILRDKEARKLSFPRHRTPVRRLIGATPR